MGKTTVIGSINMDMVTSVDKKPITGQTVTGTGFHTFFGGKGANQGVALSRLGEEVTFIGCVGKDSFGKDTINNLKDNKINTDCINLVETSTGIANIVLEDGDNSIIVVPGANHQVTRAVIDQYKEVILASDLVLLQLEIPFETVEYVIDLCYNQDVTLVLNPAPSRNIDKSLIDKVDYFIPNDSEIQDIFSVSSDAIDGVLEEYPNKIIATLGENGVKYHNGSQIKHFPVGKTNVVDTTGAGDTFCGSFCFGINNDKNIDQAIKLAMRASEIAISKLGAQTGIPYIDEIVKKGE